LCNHSDGRESNYEKTFADAQAVSDFNDVLSKQDEEKIDP
jgi:hypothetical protein